VQKELRDLLEQSLLMHFYGRSNTAVKVNGDRKQRLCNTLSVSFRGVDAHVVLKAIEKDVACSAGSACHSHEVTISRVRTPPVASNLILNCILSHL
jgi:cysteine sulfinate desulfinase/cysteine desulfurase-like protein